MPNNRSPLKSRPLRNPGQSLDEQIRDLIETNIAGPVFLAMFAVLVAVLEWWRYYHPAPPSPRIYYFAAVIVIVYAAFRVYWTLPRLRALKLGRDGEKAVGQFLERLRERGYRVFHDLIGNGFNIDHVLIGPAGIFTIETKTYSKPRSDARIVSDGDTIRMDGVKPDRDLTIQAKAQASWLRQLLAESAGRQFAVKSVIVFPGWYVEYTGPKNKSLWVLEPKMLPSFLDHESWLLLPEDIQLASFHLSRFVRTS